MALNRNDNYNSEFWSGKNEHQLEHENEDNDGYPTKSSESQKRTEKLVTAVLNEIDPKIVTSFSKLTRDYVYDGLVRGLESHFSSLDASRPWLCFWICHSLSLLGEEFDNGTIQRVIYTLAKCRNVSGGFGGGFMQIPHTAPTYASVMALITMNTREAFLTIQRGRLYRFLFSLKDGGAFRVHEDGECDTRALYTVLAVASMCNMLTPELTNGCLDWITTTQGFDGGIGAEPGNESHGGYAYCVLASLVILGANSIDLQAFARWLFMRQMQIEGGFQGRTNKLVDSCYSFWQGACFALLNRLGTKMYFPNCNSARLLQYVIGACTHGNGGFKDKPDTHRDYYHTCYALSGLSIVLANDKLTNSSIDLGMSQLKETDPVYNVTVDKLGRARAFFARLPCTHAELMALEI
jgi:protein farnesyltransferase subunit beta